MGDLFDSQEIQAEQVEPTRRDRDFYERKANEMRRLEEIQRWSLKIPEEFRQPIDRSRVTVDWQSFDKIQQWDGKKSIFTKGRSQLGKTRAIYSALMQNGRNFTVLDDWKFAAKISDAASKGKLEDLVDQWTSAQILFFDDIDKVNFTAGVTGQLNAAVFFGTVKHRMSKHLPTIISANLDIADTLRGAGVHIIKSLEERMSQDEHWLRVDFMQR